MRKLLTIIFTLWTICGSGQNLNTADEIIYLAKIYRGNHGLAGLDSNSNSIFTKYKGTKFERVAKFIEEATKEKNRIIEHEYLARPDSALLKIFHTIIMVNYNMYETSPEDNNKVVEKFLKKEVTVY